MNFEQLRQFRQTIYDCFDNAKDALFELMDAVLCNPSLPSFVSLSQSPVFRRQWPSTYAALTDGRIHRAKVLGQVVQAISTEDQPLLAGDSSVWLRPQAKTLKDRGFQCQGEGNIGIGHSYSTLAWVPQESGSWALPLRHERIASFESALTKAAFQLKQVTRQLTVRPLATFDRHYGNGQFVNQIADIEADLLVRLVSNRCVYGVPPAYPGRGAPYKHGHKFKFNAPETEPQIRSTQATQRWSDLMVLMSWQLWFARAECLDSPLPWQSPQQDLAPGRVAQGFPAIIAAIGTPAQAPKTRGNSPGRQQGQSQLPRTRFPIVKKRVAKPKKSQKSDPIGELIPA
ncbi:MAG: transposase [Thermosynechococcaceae cyanobacterium MS004]|nr:transposase [Thermosynechococcaceae cyanobacterium MS004]